MALGDVKEEPASVDSDNGRVRVTLDGFQPLCFETSIEFHSGEEVPITLRYEHLFGYCLRCHSLCHDVRDCGSTDGKGGKGDGPPQEPQDGAENMSYKGAADKSSGRRKAGEREFREEKRRGKRPVSDYHAGSDKNGRSHDVREQRFIAGTRPMGEMGRRQRGRVQALGCATAQNKKEKMSETKENGQCSDTIRPVQEANMDHGKDDGRIEEKRQIWKALFQLEEQETMENMVHMEMQEEMSLEAEKDEA